MYTLTAEQYQEILGAIAFAKGYFHSDSNDPKRPFAKMAVDRLARAADTMVKAAGR